MYQKFIQKVNSLWETFVRNRSVYKKLLSKEHGELLLEQDALSKRYERVKTELDDTQGSLNKLRDEHSGLSQKYALVSDLLTAKSSENEAFEKFKELFDGEFMAFANKESSLADEAAAVQQLQTLEKRLEKIVAFPHTFTKRSIAIGGGFSSGKSAFVNSFIEHPDIQLPVGIQPVTAIPSYVMDGVDASIKGYSRTGGTIDIPPDFYVQLSHDFIDTLSFNVKDLMPEIAVEVPLQADLFEHIYLIDTPGYNPAGGQTSEDEATSAEFLKDRDALIWMIGLDATGTVPESDLDFIEGLELNGLPFYVVLNKADLKHESDLTDIVREVWDTLDDAGIEPVGISAYSATKRKEYLHAETALHDFFRSQNHFVEDQEVELKKEIEDVFERYEEAIDKDEKTAYELRKKLNSLNLDINELGVDSDAVDVLQEKIDKIKNSQNKDFVPIKVEMKEIKTKMLRAVDEIFWSLRSQDAEATSLRVSEVAHEFNLSSTEMIALLRNLGFQPKDHMSICTPVMAEAVQKELDFDSNLIRLVALLKRKREAVQKELDFDSNA